MNWIKSVWTGFILYGLREAWRSCVSMAMKHLFLQQAEHFLRSRGNCQPLKKALLCAVRQLQTVSFGRRILCYGTCKEGPVYQTLPHVSVTVSTSRRLQLQTAGLQYVRSNGAYVTPCRQVTDQIKRLSQMSATLKCRITVETFTLSEETDRLVSRQHARRCQGSRSKATVRKCTN